MINAIWLGKASMSLVACSAVNTESLSKDARFHLH